MICKNETQTGKHCSNGYSREITCEYSVTKCLRDCGPRCQHFEPASELDAYFAKVKQAQFAPCRGCGEEERDEGEVPDNQPFFKA